MRAVGVGVGQRRTWDGRGEAGRGEPTRGEWTATGEREASEKSSEPLDSR